MNILKYISLALVVLVSVNLNAQNEDFRKSAPAPGPAPKLQMGDYTNFELDNGLQVIVVENHKLPRVSFQLYVDRPRISENEYAGTSTMVGQMLRSGTTTRDKSEIDEAVDFIGANLSTDPNGATASGLSQHAETLLALLADCIQNPTFPEEEFAKVVKQNESGLAFQKDDPEIIAQNVANQLRFGGDHPYGERMTETTLANITVEACRNFHRLYFRPSISYLVVVGDIDAKYTKQLAETYFGDWQTEGKFARELLLAPPMLQNRQVNFVTRPTAVQSVINVTYAVSLKPGSKDAIAANVLNRILGGGSNGRLFQNLREDKAYTYGAYSDLEDDPNIGYFNAYANVRTEVTDSAVHEILMEMEELRSKPVELEELNEAKSLINGAFARSLERPEVVARFALNTVLYDLPRNYYPNYLENLAKITVKDIQRVAEKYIKPDQAHVLVVGDMKAVEGLDRFTDGGEILYYNVNGKQQQQVAMTDREEISPRQVLARYIQAIGGEERIMEITDMTTVMEGEVQGMAMTMTQEKQIGEKMRTTVSMSGMAVNETVVNGEQAKVLQMGAPQELDETALAELREQTQIFPEARHAELGYQLTMNGIEPLGDKRAYVLRITSPSGNEMVEYFDVESGLKLRTITSTEAASITVDYSEYQEIDGLMYPHKVTSSGLMPTPLVFTLKSLTVNTGLSEDRFTVE